MGISLGFGQLNEWCCDILALLQKSLTGSCVYFSGVLSDSGVFTLSAVSPSSYIRSSRTGGRMPAPAVDVRLSAPLQVTAGNHLLPCVRSARSQHLL